MTNSLSATKAIHLISPFLPEWIGFDPSDLSITLIEGGALNTVHLVRCHGQSIIVKQYGGNLFSAEDCENEVGKQIEVIEVLVAHVMSAKGWGPKLLGVFAGGRIEEYVNSHNLQPSEAMIPNIRKNIAKRFAQVHSLQLPLELHRLDFVIDDMISFYSHPEKKTGFSEFISSVKHPDAATVAQYVTDFDHVKELRYTMNLLKQRRCRETTVILDCNFNNILVRNHDPDADVLLIDYEGVMHGYRGIDIGSHFANRMVQWMNRETKVTGLSYPNSDERRLFCEEYCNEMLALGQQMDPEVDSIDHLVMEAEIGSLFYFVFETCWLIKYSRNFLNDVSFMTGMKLVFENYDQAKQRFEQTYGK